MQLFVLLACLLNSFPYTEAALKTNIYIDQVPLYSKLASCAEDRVSAIIRAQASGCGDDMQLTSFACFCVDSSSEFSSIISTAVADQCSSAATEAALTARHAVQTQVERLRARATVTPAPTSTGAVAKNVRNALELFDSYCSKSTELTRFQEQSTVQVTQAPKTIFVTTTQTSSPLSSAETTGKSEKSSTPIAAIVVPVVLVPLALGIALWFFLRHRRLQRTAGTHMHELQANNAVAKGPYTEVYAHKELPGSYCNELYASPHRAELSQTQNPAAELDANAAYPTEKNGKRGF
ncbi:hypothetical protein BU23DRAFT_291142 [Bimuria novae-zelandiae CBS 107.79]|uniref:Extracellular membrane protein CFEM domain-containing protein n=1 Tax=Bimuria novae-zelandiae CBS 107.79 TaxID=1447943 RepID=A0A6A5URZ3_9PLEO|nr:hypothetical protein BU23DRAFT_291142 [Bimuria novae-zelandiae CBS 107.79]